MAGAAPAPTPRRSVAFSADGAPDAVVSLGFGRVGVVTVRGTGFRSIVGRRVKDDFGALAFACELCEGEIVVAVNQRRAESDGAAGPQRRIRVWVPRLNLVCWVWRWATPAHGAGPVPLITWFKEQSHWGARQPVGKDERDGVPRVCLADTVEVFAPPGAAPGGLHRLELCRGDLVVVTKPHVPLEKGKPDVDLRGKCALADVVPCTVQPQQVCVPQLALGDLSVPPATLVTLCRDHLSAEMLSRANHAFDDLVTKGATAAPEGREPSPFSDGVWLRYAHWRDLIDPELCLIPDMSGARWPGWRWQPADVKVDSMGNATWLSWVNHLDGIEHAALLAVLAELLQAALPAAEQASGHRLRGRTLQVVVRAYEQTVQDTEDGSPLTRISDWHTDGSDADSIVATAACYLDVDAGVCGGDLEFQIGSDLFRDDPDSPGSRLALATGTVVAFDNTCLRHMVHPIHGNGRRRTVAFHIVDPENPCEPHATLLRRQLQVQRRAEGIDVLCATLGNVLPIDVIELIWDFVGQEGATIARLVERRDRERRRRLAIRLDDSPLESTGSSPYTDDDDEDVRRMATGFFTPDMFRLERQPDVDDLTAATDEIKAVLETCAVRRQREPE